MEKHGKANIIVDLKESDEETLFDVLQDWINWNDSVPARQKSKVPSSDEDYDPTKGY